MPEVPLRSCLYALLLVACALPALASQKPAPADADAAELAYYRLTPANLEKVINVNRTVLQELLRDPKVQEGLRIDAELEALSSKAEPTEADEKRIAELEARKAILEDAVDNPLGGDARTLADLESRLKRYPPMEQALRREGMAPRDYAKFWITFLQSAFAHAFQKSGMLKKLPADVNPENVQFIADHEAEIEAMQKEFEALGKRK